MCRCVPAKIQMKFLKCIQNPQILSIELLSCPSVIVCKRPFIKGGERKFENGLKGGGTKFLF